MRILIVSQYFWPESFRVNDLALGLKERGHAVAVLTGLPNYPTGRFFPSYGFFTPSSEEFNGLPVYRVPLIPRGSGQRWRLALNYFSFAIFASLLAPLGIVSFYLSVYVADVDQLLAHSLILRRWVEGIGELHLSEEVETLEEVLCHRGFTNKPK